MNKSVVINVETHFIEKDGRVYAQSIMDSMFWKKYLNVFSRLYVLGRVKPYDGEDLRKWIVSDYENVYFAALPDYRGPKGYLRKYFQIGKVMDDCIKDHKDICCAIIRAPSPLGYRFLKKWLKTGKPYGLEIVANYTDRFYYNIDCLHSILYRRLHQMTKKYAWNADGVAYVTKEVLQKAYPTHGLHASYSSIDLPKHLFFKREPLSRQLEECVLIHVSTLELDVKGNEEFFLIQRRLIDDGYNVKSVVVGGGRYLAHYRQRAKDIGIDDRVRFSGHISSKEALMRELQEAHIFLFPTLTEGLPRTVIEAMASSLPCISSDIPSLRELIDTHWLCGAKDVAGFTERVKELIDNIDTYNSVACRNYEAACEYEYSVLNKKRRQFFCGLIDMCNERSV